MGLEVNLKIAKWAVEKTQRLVPFSTNLNETETTVAQEVLLELVRRKVPKPIKQQIIDFRLSPKDGDYEQDDELRKLINLKGMPHFFKNSQLVDLFCEHYETKSHGGRHKDNTWRTKIHDIENNARNSIDARVGNCQEMSSIAYCLLLECPEYYREKNKIRFEYLAFDDPGDHCFIVIGRCPYSKLSDMRSWGSEAVICDPWGNASWAVAEEFKKSRANRASLFEHINTHLQQSDLTFVHANQVSSGHSKRWQAKGRVDLRFRSNFDLFWARTCSSEPPLVGSVGVEEQRCDFRVRR